MADFAIYLASRSPRRRELLRQIGVTFQPLSADVLERRAAGETPEAFVRRAALDKARAGWADAARNADRPVLGADTAVVLGDEVLGKPRDREHGLAMLERLSGRTHRVLTGIAVVRGGHEGVELSASTVRFRALSERECAAYWATGEPADKAGAYAIQGLGAVFVAELEGSYSGVMGLALFETARLLGAFGVSVV